jgi:hypothetical protein
MDSTFPRLCGAVAGLGSVALLASCSPDEKPASTAAPAGTTSTGDAGTTAMPKAGADAGGAANMAGGAGVAGAAGQGGSMQADPPPPGNLAELVDNEWIELPTSVAASPGLEGSYQQRGWCTLRFAPGLDTLFFYEGFQQAERGDYCIYANALYELDPTDGIARQRTLSNWYCDDSGGYRKLEGQSESPVDRHTYAQFAYAASTGRVYMIAGAASRFDQADQPYDFWSYAPADGGVWERMPESYPGAEADRAASVGPYTGNLLHHSPTDTLYYFMSASRIHRYAIDSGEWSTISDAPGSEEVTEVGGHGLYDSERDRFAFYGNNWHPEDAGSTEFAFFDVASESWQLAVVPPAPDGPPPKSYAPIEYDSENDVYLLHAGWKQNDTWVYDPKLETWSAIATSTAPPPAGTGTYLAYASTYGVLFRLDDSVPRLYALRYRPGP